MDTKNVKKSVVESYGKLAKSRSNNLFTKLFACCDPIETAQKVAENIGYSQEDLAQVPKDANLGVGCGNPAALTTIKQGETVVDLGSGAGFDSFIVARTVGENGKVIGVDLSTEMLALANKNAQKGRYTHVEFVKGDIEALPLADNVADHVISNCVINLSLHKDKVYQEAYRVLKTGGSLAISDIVLEKELPDFIKESLAGHIACVSGAEKLETYLAYVKEAGFEDIKLVAKKAFPLELMLTDPQLLKIAEEMNFDLESEAAKDIAARVTSISLIAKKLK
ncbi:MAG: arsenite methyltransferase [Saprospiraceae bacterium]